MNPTLDSIEELSVQDYDTHTFKHSLVIHANCFEWMVKMPPNSIHAIVTDPPYGVKEYEARQLEKRDQKNGGVWRIPPSFDGSNRAPLPRFTALNKKEREQLHDFFMAWAALAVRILRPGGHVFVASNALLSNLVFSALVEGGLEFRGELIRLVQTFRGGDRPKNAEQEFPQVSSMARSSYEPWGIFRKPFNTTLAECLREFQTGGLRRLPDGNPFRDVLPSERTPKQERLLAHHPSLKPQSFLRQVVYVVLPLGEGIILDPFMGSGSTIAAAEAQGISAIGVEVHQPYYAMSLEAIPALSSLVMDDKIETSTMIPNDFYYRTLL